MVFGFDDNKNKVEVYPKNDFVVISETITNITQQPAGFYSGFARLTGQVLLSNYGISDLRKYMIISINTCEFNDDWNLGTDWPAPSEAAMIYPNVWCDSTDYNSLKINVFSSSGASVKVRILLLKVA